MSPSALTTAFQPPSSCLTDVLLYSWTSGKIAEPIASVDWVAPGQYAGFLYFGLPGFSECLPTGWATSSYYSPGICPGGYTVACSSLNSIGTITETVATCCPRYDMQASKVMNAPEKLGLIPPFQWLFVRLGYAGYQLADYRNMHKRFHFVWLY